MNFKISKRIFYNALQVVARAISANSPLPSLSGIKIEVNEESIVLTGSDSDISIQKVLNTFLRFHLKQFSNMTYSLYFVISLLLNFHKLYDNSLLYLLAFDFIFQNIATQHRC